MSAGPRVLGDIIQKSTGTQSKISWHATKWKSLSFHRIRYTNGEMIWQGLHSSYYVPRSKAKHSSNKWKGKKSQKTNREYEGKPTGNFGMKMIITQAEKALGGLHQPGDGSKQSEYAEEKIARTQSEPERRNRKRSRAPSTVEWKG